MNLSFLTWGMGLTAPNLQSRREKYVSANVFCNNAFWKPSLSLALSLCPPMFQQTCDAGVTACHGHCLFLGPSQAWRLGQPESKGASGSSLLPAPPDTRLLHKNTLGPCSSSMPLSLICLLTAVSPDPTITFTLLALDGRQAQIHGCPQLRVVRTAPRLGCGPLMGAERGLCSLPAPTSVRLSGS